MRPANYSHGSFEQMSGWGNCPSQLCQKRDVRTWSDAESAVTYHASTPVIARGLGRAYGDSAISSHGTVLDLTRLNRFLAFDPETGILECEAGVSFAEIIEHFLPRGWFMPTTPGTKYVTVGGAIAADVHGKNHHIDGSFGNFVSRLKLLLADGNIVECSPAIDPELFWATVGGMGLTGIILSAEIQLVRVDTAYCVVDYRRTRNLEATLGSFASTHHHYRYSVAWIDCVATGASLGRSVVMLGNNARQCDLSARAARTPLALPRRSKRNVPFHFPAGTLNSWTVRAFNALYYARNYDRRETVDFDAFYYPLDGIRNWNRIYGRSGLVQYQALFPTATARAGLQALLECIAESRQASFLAVLKGCGPATPGMLSFLFPGYTLALDFPYRGRVTQQLFEKLDQIVLDHTGRLYLAKDSQTSAENFSRMYPRLDEFRDVKRRVDPENRFVSSQARRLGIVQTSVTEPAYN